MTEYEKYDQEERAKTVVHNHYTEGWGCCMGPIGDGRRSVNFFSGAWLSLLWAGSLSLVILGL